MLSILKKSKVTEMDIRTGIEILKKHRNLFPADWEVRLMNTPKEEVSKIDNKAATVQNTEYTLRYTKVDGNSSSIRVKTGKHSGYVGLLGSNVIVTSSNGKIHENQKNKCIVTLSKAKDYTIKLDSKTVITITAQEKANVKQRTFNE